MLVDDPVLVAARVDRTALADNGAALPPLLRELAGRPTRRVVVDASSAPSTAGLAARLAGLSPEARQRELVDLVRASAATVLGLPNPADIDSGRAFQGLGFDSLTAVELRNRLKNATGLTLSPTLIFDYPTPVVLAEHLGSQLVDTDGQSGAMARFDDITRELAALLSRSDWTPEDKALLDARIQNLLGTFAADQPGPGILDDDLQAATESELFAILDEELGH